MWRGLVDRAAEEQLPGLLLLLDRLRRRDRLGGLIHEYGQVA